MEGEVVKRQTRMFARVSGQGTAMGETALCEDDLDNGKRHAQPNVTPEDGGVSEDWEDCTGNDALHCVVCEK